MTPESENVSGGVCRVLRVAGDDLLDPGAYDAHLVDRRAGERDRVGDQGGDLVARETERVVGGEPGEDVVVGRPWRMSRATPTARSLIASWAVSRPTPLRTAAISTLVVARNGR